MLRFAFSWGSVTALASAALLLAGSASEARPPGGFSVGVGSGGVYGGYSSYGSGYGYNHGGYGSYGSGYGYNHSGYGSYYPGNGYGQGYGYSRGYYPGYSGSYYRPSYGYYNSPYSISVTPGYSAEYSTPRYGYNETATPGFVSRGEYGAAAPASVEVNAAEIKVRVPPDAEIWFNGTRTKQRGEVRSFETPALDPNGSYSYEVRARWMENGREVNQIREVDVHAGDRLTVDLRQPNSEKRNAARRSSEAEVLPPERPRQPATETRNLERRQPPAEELPPEKPRQSIPAPPTPPAKEIAPSSSKPPVP